MLCGSPPGYRARYLKQVVGLERVRGVGLNILGRRTWVGFLVFRSVTDAWVQAALFHGPAGTRRSSGLEL